LNKIQEESSETDARISTGKLNLQQVVQITPGNNF
jgi:hypothetical protein